MGAIIGVGVEGEGKVAENFVDACCVALVRRRLSTVATHPALVAIVVARPAAEFAPIPRASQLGRSRDPGS